MKTSTSQIWAAFDKETFLAYDLYFSEETKMQPHASESITPQVELMPDLVHELNALKIVVDLLVRVVAGNEESLRDYLKPSEANQG